MRLVFMMPLIFALAAAAGAQTKVSGKAECAKPGPNYSVEIGDRPGHVLGLMKAACTWPTPMEIEGSPSKEGTDIDTIEINGMRGTDRGYYTSATDSGDKFTVRFQGTATMTKEGMASSFEGKWSFVSGTGKLKGIKGGGTYKGTGNPDGSAAYEVEGEYQIMAAAPAKMPKKSK